MEKKTQLTVRELQIIQAFSLGLSTREIAEQYFISLHTVEAHRRNAIRKFQARNTTHLVRLVLAQQEL